MKMYVIVGGARGAAWKTESGSAICGGDWWVALQREDRRKSEAPTCGGPLCVPPADSRVKSRVNYYFSTMKA